MIRPFGLRDLALIRRLSKQGTLLHAESALTKRRRPLRGAFLSMITRGEIGTYVWRDARGSGFVQFVVRKGGANAQLLVLATTAADDANAEAANGDRAGEPALNEDGWLALLDGAVEAAGRQGAHALLADVDEGGPALPILRRAGFAVYTRQDIWMLAQAEHAGAEPILRPASETDAWDVEWLYTNTVPPLIQLVEPAPPDRGEIWVLREDGELTAFAHIDKGYKATWLQIYIHPNAYVHASEIVAAAAQIVGAEPAHPLYCCVRRYQSWLQSALDASGFALCRRQAVMVKHIATPVQKKVSDLSKLLSAQQIRPNTLLQRYEADGPPGHASPEGRRQRTRALPKGG